jgi:hypothetical protein
MGKALGYSISRWRKLTLYATNGKLNIDNNPVENQIRPVAIGRKNYLFAGSHKAAKRSAMLYSLMSTCKLHGINPFIWLRDVLQRIATHPINKIEELLPRNWIPYLLICKLFLGRVNSFTISFLMYLDGRIQSPTIFQYITYSFNKKRTTPSGKPP